MDKNGQKKHQILCVLGILPILCFCPIPADSPLLLLRGNYRQKWAKMGRYICTGNLYISYSYLTSPRQVMFLQQEEINNWKRGKIIINRSYFIKYHKYIIRSQPVRQQQSEILLQMKYVVYV